MSDGGKEKSRALNMVIKLSSVDGKPTVKISDEITKVRNLTSSRSWTATQDVNGVQNTGDPATVRLVKGIFGIPITDKDEVIH